MAVMMPGRFVPVVGVRSIDRDTASPPSPFCFGEDEARPTSFEGFS